MDAVVLDRIEAESKKEPKFALLRSLGEDTKRLLQLVCDPMVTFGVTVDEDHMVQGWKNCTSRMRAEMYSDALHNLCKDLSVRKVTGNLAENSIRNLLIEAPTVGHLKWSCRILNKNLRAGFTSSSLNKIWKGFIEEFKVGLAEPYDPDKHELQGSWIVEPKLDGLRMVVINGVAYTRNGRTLESVGHILKELEQYTGDWVFDGEVMGSTEFNEDSGKIRKKGAGANEELVYNVFDVVSIGEWTARQTKPLHERKLDLVRLVDPVKTGHVRLVEWFDLPSNPSTEELFKTRDKLIGLGFEGAMLKDNTSPYIFKRSDAVIKLKDFISADVEIVDFYEGKGRHKGRLGGVFIKVDDVKPTTKVGSGFSDEQRDEIWQNRKLYMGRTVEVQYQNETPDGRLRFPTFTRFRPDKD